MRLSIVDVYVSRSYNLDFLRDEIILLFISLWRNENDAVNQTDLVISVKQHQLKNYFWHNFRLYGFMV